MKKFVLVDNKGRTVTDSNGYIRIWHNYNQAKTDSKELSGKLGMSLMVRTGLDGQISSGVRRIVV